MPTTWCRAERLFIIPMAGDSMEDRVTELVKRFMAQHSHHVALATRPVPGGRNYSFWFNNVPGQGAMESKFVRLGAATRKRSQKRRSRRARIIAAANSNS